MSIVKMLSSAHLNVENVPDQVPEQHLVPTQHLAKPNEQEKPALVPQAMPVPARKSPVTTSDKELRSDYSLFRHVVDEFATTASESSPPARVEATAPKEAQRVAQVTRAPTRAPPPQAKTAVDLPLRADYQLSQQISFEFSAGALSVESEASARLGATLSDEPAPIAQEIEKRAPKAMVIRPPAPASKPSTTKPQTLMPAPWLGVSNELSNAFPGQASPSPPARRSRGSSRANAEDSLVLNKENGTVTAGVPIAMGKFKYAAPVRASGITA